MALKSAAYVPKMTIDLGAEERKDPKSTAFPLLTDFTVTPWNGDNDKVVCAPSNASKMVMIIEIIVMVVAERR